MTATLYSALKNLLTLWVTQRHYNTRPQRWLLPDRIRPIRQRRDGCRHSLWAISVQGNALETDKCLRDISTCYECSMFYAEVVIRSIIFGWRRRRFTNAVAAYLTSLYCFKVDRKRQTHLETEENVLLYRRYGLPWANDSPQNIESSVENDECNAWLQTADEHR